MLNKIPHGKILGSFSNKKVLHKQIQSYSNKLELARAARVVQRGQRLLVWLRLARGQESASAATFGQCVYSWLVRLDLAFAARVGQWGYS